MSVRPIPANQRGITPYLCVKDAARAIEFYKTAFGAQETMRIGAPGDKVGHAELRFGDATLMLADEFPEMDFRGPQSLGGSPVMLHVYVEDADASVERALKAGATLKRPVADQFYGDRGGQIVDPFGHSWWLATHKEELSREEIEKRAAAPR
jgi:PhnB protein